MDGLVNRWEDGWMDGALQMAGNGAPTWDAAGSWRGGGGEGMSWTILRASSSGVGVVP